MTAIHPQVYDVDRMKATHPSTKEESRMDKELMRYIPKEYKAQVENIYKAEREWNEYTQRWNQTITVEWTDGETNTYQNAGYMKNLLKEFGR